MSDFQSAVFERDNIKLHYYVLKNGNPPLLMFHGFGQTGEAFNVLVSSLSKKHDIYSFDLFFHGESDWLSVDLYQKEEWKHFFCDFLKNEKISSFSILSFSIGTRFALSLCEGLEDQKIEEVFLIAPEGLSIHWFYYMVTYVPFFRLLFYVITVNPQPFFKITSLLQKLSILNKKDYHFLNKVMMVKEQRLRLYRTWIVFRKLFYNQSLVVSCLNKHKIPVKIFASKRDNLISYRLVQSFAKKIKNVHLQTYSVSHFGLIQATKSFFEQKM
ncbi:MAG: alpha/beta hydrolase [Cytophagales bacterium]|nr:alpha/beta hydrolase [Cytophagales bacterium]